MASLPPNSHSRYLGGGRDVVIFHRDRGSRSGNTSLPKDETAVGSDGAGASLDVVGIKLSLAHIRVKGSPAHRSEEGGEALGVKH